MIMDATKGRKSVNRVLVEEKKQGNLDLGDDVTFHEPLACVFSEKCFMVDRANEIFNHK